MHERMGTAQRHEPQRHGARRPAARALALVVAVCSVLLGSVLVPAVVAPGAAGAAVPSAVGGRTSPDGRFRLVMQADGNLVLYAPGPAALWHTRTAGRPGATAVLQADGNLVLRSRAGAVLWHTRTWGHPGARLAVQDDGNLVLRAATGRVVWAAGSHGPAARLGFLTPAAECAAGPCETVTGDRAAVRDAVNATRAAAGLRTLVQHPALNRKADDAARALRDACHLSHSRLVSGAPAGWKQLGENVGMGADVAEVHAAYVASPSHLANVVNPAFTHVGTAAVWGTCPAGRVVVTVQVFMQA